MQQQRVLKIFLLCLFWVFAGAVIAEAQIVVTMASTPACSLDGTVTATVTGGVPPYTYGWWGPHGLIAVNAPNLTGVEGGSYYLRVEDQNSIIGWGSATVTPPFGINVTSTDEMCGDGSGTATGSVLTGGVAPFTYAWSNGMTGPTISGLHQGLYEITVTDAMGCFVSSSQDSFVGITSAYVNNGSPLTFNITSTGSVCTDGTASVTNIANGTAPYTYVWSTTPPQFTATATGLAGNSYGQVTVTDAAGCTSMNYYNITQLGNGLNAYASSTDETCTQSNGTATCNVFGGTGPFTYLWSNGATSASITGLSYGGYHVTITDGMGCPAVASTYVGRNEPLTLLMTGVNPNCNNQNGSVSVNVLGGTPPYTYNWYNGSTTNSISNMGEGNYGVWVTDANGCSDNEWQWIHRPWNCYGTVEGYALGDLNGNCIHDGSDLPLVNTIIDLGSTYAVTNPNGFYQQDLLPGTYTIAQPTPANYYAQTCPASPNTYTVNNLVPQQVVSNLDFFNAATANVDDLVIAFYPDPARPTAPQNVYIYFENRGSTLQNPTINFVHDPLMTFQSGGWNLTNYNLGTRTLTFNPGPMYPGENGYVYCTFSIPTNTVIGTAYSHYAEILPNSSDATPLDNQSTYAGTVVGSYDPNLKSVSPDGMITTDDSILTYTVQFQNTGNDTAFTVAILDTIDANLDIFSLEVLGASHDYTLDAMAPGVLKFTFADIMLPDSIIDEPNSHGHIIYRLKQKANLPVGTQIRNQAAIYFDYNAPVMTNTTLNTLGVAAAATSATDIDPAFTLFPNPANDRVSILLGDNWQGETQVTVRDINGRPVHHATMQPSQGRVLEMNLSNLGSGVYLVECTHKGHRLVRKLVLQ